MASSQVQRCVFLVLYALVSALSYQHRDRLLIANVGDSRAVLGRCDTARKSGLPIP